MADYLVKVTEASFDKQLARAISVGNAGQPFGLDLSDLETARRESFKALLSKALGPQVSRGGRQP